MWCYFCDDAKGGTLFPSSVICIFPLFEHSKGSTFIRLSKRIERIFAFFCLLFYTLYIYTRARALPGCVRLDYALPHHTTHHAHQGSSFWSILDAFCFSFLSSRESGICDEEGGGAQNSRFSGIVSSRALRTLLPARIENPWIGGLEVRNWWFSERTSPGRGSFFSIIQISLQLFVKFGIRVRQTPIGH